MVKLSSGFLANLFSMGLMLKAAVFDGADAFLDRSHRMLAYDPASKKDVSNLTNWTNNTSSIARDETAYLSYPSDLMTISPSSDESTVSQLIPIIESLICRFFKAMGKVSSIEIL